MPKFCPNKNVIRLGVLPDGVYPTCSCEDNVFLYYREDGDLYFYDCSKHCNPVPEWNLFHLTCANIPPVEDVTIVYFGLTAEEVTEENILSLLDNYNYSDPSIDMTIEAQIPPITGYVYLAIPNNYSFNLLQSFFVLTLQYEFVSTIVINDINYDLYKDTTESTIDMTSIFNLTLI